MIFAKNGKIDVIIDLFGNILESPDFIFARKRHKTTVASTLNSNNNNKSQRQQ